MYIYLCPSCNMIITSLFPSTTASPLSPHLKVRSRVSSVVYRIYCTPVQHTIYRYERKGDMGMGGGPNSKQIHWERDQRERRVQSERDGNGPARLRAGNSSCRKCQIPRALRPYSPDGNRSRSRPQALQSPSHIRPQNYRDSHRKCQHYSRSTPPGSEP